MPSLEEVLAYRKKRYEESIALIQRKGADYNRKQQLDGDTLFNLKVCSILGIVDNECQGVLVRLSDKFMRLISLTSNPLDSPAVTNESVNDTINDIHNYVDYLGLFYENARKPSYIAASTK